MANMLLSKLAYECIKDSVTLPNSEFLYYAFTKGEYTENSDYVLQREQAMGAINLALSRLADYKKIPLSHIRCKLFKKDDCTWYAAIPDDCREICNVYSQRAYDYENHTFTEGDRDVVGDFIVTHENGRCYLVVPKENSEAIETDRPYAVTNVVFDMKTYEKDNRTAYLEEGVDDDNGNIKYRMVFISGKKMNESHIESATLVIHDMTVLSIPFSMADPYVQVEYHFSFPHFTFDDIVPAYGTGETDIVDTGKVYTRPTDNNIDLSIYGIDSNAFSYIKEFVKGQIYEIIDPSMASYHSDKAELYFDQMPVYDVRHYQAYIKKVI